ncbi:RluA family pseudouridine synthase [Ellagibacter isourolithinifaciens]|uniref:RluA family pseudouridine synthase n=1 Tax=Ellagibacter isourolithinifaciens TaxID=2137581 RepID=UPI003A927602
MARMLSYSATALDAGERLDSLLAARACFASRSAAARAIESGNVFVNGANVVKKYAVAAGDVIVYQEEEEVEAGPVTGQPIDLDIRFEDDDLIVLSKQIGLVCHPSVDHADGTLVNALIYHCGADHLCNVQGEDDRLGIVHRLDRDTSGLMLAAKTDAAGYALMEDIRDRAVDRHYLALVHGVIAPDTGMIDAPIARSANERTRMAVRDVPSARDAVTTFRVLERFEPRQHDDGYTLIDCKLFTGRTHQIRVHMQYAKHPLVGDPVYTSNGPKDARAQLGLKRQFLHSFRIRFIHPETSEELEFADNLPRDLDEALHSLGDRSRGMTDAGREVAALLTDAPRPSAEGELPE